MALYDLYDLLWTLYEILRPSLVFLDTCFCSGGRREVVFSPDKLNDLCGVMAGGKAGAPRQGVAQRSAGRTGFSFLRVFFLRVCVFFLLRVAACWLA